MQTNVMLFKTTDSAQLRADLQTHVENRDLIHVTNATPSWVSDILIKQIKKDIENSKPLNITFASHKLLEKVKFSKRPEINKLYIDLYLNSKVYANPKNIVMITDPKNASEDDFTSALVNRILTIEKVYGLKSDPYRVGVVYIPAADLCWANY